MSIAFAVIAVVVLLVLARSVRIASEWQRAVILRLGRFHKVKGPGIYLVFPLIDAVAQVIDLRIQTTMITAEQALTRDTVAVGVDAIVFWQVEERRKPRPFASPTTARRSSGWRRPACAR